MVSTTNINKIQHYANSRLPKRIFARIFFNVFLMIHSPFTLSIQSINTESSVRYSHHMSLYTGIFIIIGLCVFVVLYDLLYRWRQTKSAQKLHPIHTTHSCELLWASTCALIKPELILISDAVTHYFERY